MNKELRKEIREALTCDKGCGHKLDPKDCFIHQCERIVKLITYERTYERRKLLEKFEELISKEWDRI